MNQLMITRITLIHYFLKIIGGMPIIKSIVSSKNGLYGISRDSRLLYRQ